VAEDESRSAAHSEPVAQAPSGRNRRFRELVARLRDGSNEAAKQIIDEYGPHIRSVVRRSMNPRMRSVFDSIDFEQEVWASLVRIQTRLDDLDDPGELFALLMEMARNKVIDEIRRRVSARSSDDFWFTLRDSDMGICLSGNQADPTPSQVLAAKERWRSLVDNQPEQVRRALQLRLDGASPTEIAKELQIDLRSVRRYLMNAKSRSSSYEPDPRKPQETSSDSAGMADAL